MACKPRWNSWRANNEREAYPRKGNSSSVKFSTNWAMLFRMQDTKVAIAITGKFGEPDADISEANARRIAACWNACDGIPTAWLEGGAADILEHSIALIKQRDELLALLTEVAGNFTRDDDLPDNLLPRIDAAIDKVEGGAA